MKSVGLLRRCPGLQRKSTYTEHGPREIEIVWMSYVDAKRYGRLEIRELPGVESQLHDLLNTWARTRNCCEGRMYNEVRPGCEYCIQKYTDRTIHLEVERTSLIESPPCHK